ncbi:MAG: type II CRISPR RNA-guided endonuclease Cas9 [Cytophagales bacterium]|nr:type II CRISPR RNA-guided endonuclease Cas9 [Cytophagales bacterium]MDW8384295.1 type II CRISPR RNA-guided endonuclease Cas9 [Flammeovirgaceae bacterium]
MEIQKSITENHDIVFGIDIGFTSIGWAVVSKKQQKILGSGCYIFPVGVNEDSYNKNYAEESKNQTRRLARSLRRRLFRRKLRVVQLLFLLEENGFFASIKKPQNLREQYKNLPKAERSSLLKKFSAEIQQYMHQNGFLSTDIYSWRAQALDTRIELWQLGLIFLQFAKRRGFKSNRKEKTDEKKKGEIEKAISALKEEMQKENVRTLGEYFYKLICKSPLTNRQGKKDRPIQRIRNCYTERKMYEDEFEAIWEAQKKYYPDKLSGDKSGDVRNSEFCKTLYYQIKNWCIFFQRPLKSQKKLVGNCTFLPHKKRCPIAALEFQEFRIWQFLGNLRITTTSKREAKKAQNQLSLFESRPRYNEPLSLEEKKKLAQLFSEKEKVTISDIKKELGYENAKFSAENIDYKGNVVRVAFKKAFGNKDFEEMEKEYKQKEALDEQNCFKTSERFKTKFYKLWNALLFADSTSWLQEYAKKLGYSEQQAEEYSKIFLPEGYASLSLEAIRSILAYMKEGYEYHEACMYAGFHHSKQEIPVKGKISPKDIPNLRAPIVQKAICETARLVNHLVKKFGEPDHIRVEMAREFKQPKSEREKRARKNYEIKKRREEYVELLKKYKPDWNIHPKSDIIKKFELWLELGLDDGELKNKLIDDRKINEFKKFAKKVNSKDKEKYALWLECGRVSPYTGKTISLTKLFSSDIEIEHIIPYSLSGDDSMTNKTIAEREENAKKGNLTAFAYMQSKGKKELDEYIERISAFPKYKQKYFLAKEASDEFANVDFQSTAYIAKELTKLLKLVCKNVYITNGKATAIIRRHWGLHNLLQELWQEQNLSQELLSSNESSDNKTAQEEKMREDHRHHAIDAIVIALTSQSIFNKLAREAQFSSSGHMRVKEIPLPWGTLNSFRNDVNKSVANILVAFRNKKRLLSKKKIKKGNSVTISIVPRDKLHAETNYGFVQLPCGRKGYVQRKPLADYFNDVENEEKSVKKCEAIVDRKIANILLERLRNYDFNGKRAFSQEAIQKEPVLTYSKKGTPNPIYKVRFFVESNTAIPLKPHENPKLYVEPDNNYMMAIYRDPQTDERVSEIVTFIEAFNRKKRGEAIFEPIKKKVVQKREIELPLWLTLSKKDMFVLYDNHPEEIDWNNPADIFNRLYYVIKMSGNNIYLGKHHIAKINADRDKFPIKKLISSNKFKGVKVFLSPLGEIVKKVE